jgi:hypothetical protein
VREHRRFAVSERSADAGLVVANLRAQPGGVVAELADFRRGLVDERRSAVGACAPSPT